MLYKNQFNQFCIHKPILGNIGINVSLVIGLIALENNNINFQELLNLGYKNLGLILKSYNKNLRNFNNWVNIFKLVKQDKLLELFCEYRDFINTKYPSKVINFVEE